MPVDTLLPDKRKLATKVKNFHPEPTKRCHACEEDNPASNRRGIGPHAPFGNQRNRKITTGPRLSAQPLRPGHTAVPHDVPGNEHPALHHQSGSPHPALSRMGGVGCAGGGTRGTAQLLNLVLDEVEEQVQDPEPRIRALGLAVLRGPTITLLSPVDGLEEISNPFLAQE